MTDIPFDPSLVLGNIIDRKKIEYLQQLAVAEKPEVLLRRKLNSLMRNKYKLEGVLTQLESLYKGKEVDNAALNPLKSKIIELKEKIAGTGVALVRTTIKCEQSKQALRLKQGQQTISKQIESPLNYSRSKVTTFPLAADGLEMDVQYFRNEGVDDENNSHAETVGSYVADRLSGLEAANTGSTNIGNPSKTSTANAVNSILSSQNSKHKIEGTLVILASCNHMQADVISPCILNPEKTVDAWNNMFPEERLETDIKTMMEALFDDSRPKTGVPNAIHLLTGCAKASSFVGMVHVVKNEKTENFQSSGALADTITSEIQKELWFNSRKGKSGVSKGFTGKLQNALSSANLYNHCTLVTKGFLPNISISDIKLTTQEVKPDPKQLMAELNAVNTSCTSNLPGEDAIGKELGSGEKSSNFLTMSLNGAANAVSTVTENARDYSVIDTNSLMTAFTDYIQKASEGLCGVPVTFFTKEIRRQDVARTYVKAFYPSGDMSGKDYAKGQLGINSNENEE